MTEPKGSWETRTSLTLEADIPYPTGHPPGGKSSSRGYAGQVFELERAEVNKILGVTSRIPPKDTRLWKNQKQHQYTANLHKTAQLGNGSNSVWAQPLSSLLSLKEVPEFAPLELTPQNNPVYPETSTHDEVLFWTVQSVN